MLERDRMRPNATERVAPGPHITGAYLSATIDPSAGRSHRSVLTEGSVTTSRVVQFRASWMV